ncbi:Callose synthase 7 [Apostasia shenzhenica]|uniref:1,3-beta-glucan synthase n=1 Tax=Apostasia shenzhenica TaxID=1088818 RepID=A0A2I0B127_9ASPA|nr:Callose synthase 7 [Apostasia shenzhenica]
MASSSGIKGPGEVGLEKMLSRRMTRLPTMLEGGEEEPTADSELVPSSLVSIVPILRVANEIEPLNRRVAYLCRFHAFEKAHNLDPTSSGRGVRQFKTYLLHRLEKFILFIREEMAKHYQIASVLYDVLKTVVPSEKVDDEINRYAREVERKKVHFTHYNILPLHASGAASPIMQLPEIKAAVHALSNVDNLPMPRVSSAENTQQKVGGSLIPEDGSKSINNLLDWLGLVFGFQLDSGTVKYLLDKVTKNYLSWCAYLHIESNLKFPPDAATQQLELLYIGLYLLIWGEASNIRFMPECICYIFHNMANELRGILFGNVYSVSGGYVESSSQGEESFLREVVTPIYQVLRKEAQRNKGGTASHSKWRNYDDLNEFFWSIECFKLGWPLNRKAVFFVEEMHLRTEAMLIIAWSPSGSIAAIFDSDVFRSVLSIFITASFLNFLQAALDIVLSWKAWGSMEYTQIIRYLLKFVVATAWVIILPVSYSSSVQNPTGLIKFFSNWASNWQGQPLFNFAVVIYMIPNILAALLFMVPPLRRAMERSNWRVITLVMWWAQPKLYVGRGMHEDLFTLLKYTLFWILLLICKLAFSYYVEFMNDTVQHNIGVVIAIWAPIVLVYFMDAQIWYAIFSTIFGGINGAFSHLGEIRTLGMLRSRFESVPIFFTAHLVPFSREEESRRSQEESERRNIARFAHVWNAFIKSLREEDLISNNEQLLLLVPYSSGDVTVVQWPPFLLASKIPIALDMAKDFKKKGDADLFNKIKYDNYMHSAVIECYETLRDILYSLLVAEEDRQVIRHICYAIDTSIQQRKFLNNFRMSELPQLSSKLEKLLNLLKGEHEDLDASKTQIINVLQDIIEIITQDVMINAQGILEKSEGGTSGTKPMFSNLNFELMENKSWMEKVVRLHLLLTVKESAINVPTNLDARRRITFFANSLFMNMPSAPKVRNMLSFSVLTPYYKEDVLYSEEELKKENEDGISILFYLEKIYPVRGMMYYRDALELQCFLDMAEDQGMLPVGFSALENLHNFVPLSICYILAGHRPMNPVQHYQDEMAYDVKAQAITDMKYTYVVSCQVYGMQKKSAEARDKSCYQNILNLMLVYPQLRVAYIDEREETVDGKSVKFYYSVLVKGGDKLDEEIYRIKLPGRPNDIGEGKPENQNHALIFTRGEALQTIDMNQDNYLEEAFKIRNVLQEFLRSRHRQRCPTIVGLREHIFTGSVSSLAWFMSNQETSFVTIGQRILANPLKVRFHYGHPDVFDRIFHLTRGGVSKASKTINLSEDIFSGFNSTLRGGNVVHKEYMQVGKGRDVGMNQISLFEAKVSNGNGEQTLSRDVYRLGRRFDFYRMLSFYFTTVGFYFSSMVTVLTVYVFLYGRLYLVMSGLEKSILENPTVVQNIKPLESALASQSVFQLGLFLVLPMMMEVGLEKGFRTAIGEFVIMQLQLAPVFFTFQLGTKAHYYGRTILHGGAKYRATGRGFVVFHAKFADNYRLYSRSHFVKGLELMMLLVVYKVYGQTYRSSKLYLFVTFSMWFLVTSWLFAPFIFNPSVFEWEKTVNDWTDWKKWMGNRGGIGIAEDRSWESWWENEQEHLKYTSIRARVLEILLSLRFLIYQYGIVYHLDIAHHSRSILVYGLSWLVMLTVLLVLKIGQALRPMFKRLGFWDSIKELGRAYEYVMGIVILAPVAVLSWFPFVSEFQTRLLFNQAFSRGLQISRILAGRKDSASPI